MTRLHMWDSSQVQYEMRQKEVFISECVFSEVQAKWEERVGYQSCSNVNVEIPTFGKYLLPTSAKNISTMIKCIFAVMYETNHFICINIWVLSFFWKILINRTSRDSRWSESWVRGISRVSITCNLSTRSVMASESQRPSFQRLRTCNS